jgi:drug/metabolite transporter (DMT)-like permease
VSSSRVTVDALLLLMTLIWGSNYSIVKIAFRELPPQAFNGVRMLLASAIFLALIAATGWQSVTRRDVVCLTALGFIGHFIYQICFIGGLARTSVANSSLIIGCSPVTVMLLSAAVGQDRVHRSHWAGILMSVGGVYLVVGRGASVGGATLLGDLLTVAAICCWAAYTVFGRPLLTRFSPLVVTGYSLALGTLLYVPFTLPQLVAMDLSRVSAKVWVITVVSAVLSLCLSYWIWYRAVQEIGNVRTSVYSNLVPLVAMAVATVWLGEPLDAPRIGGATLILFGVAMTRVQSAAASAVPPAEE